MTGATTRWCPERVRFRLASELADEGVRVRRPCYALVFHRLGSGTGVLGPSSARALRHPWLPDVITAVPAETRGTYGRERMHAELVHGHELHIGDNTIGLLMRRAGLADLPIYRQRGERTPPGGTTITDLVKRKFTRSGPNELWATDITEHPTREGKLSCFVVSDSFSRRVVGWLIESRTRADLKPSSRSDPRAGQVDVSTFSGAPQLSGGSCGGSPHGLAASGSSHWQSVPRRARGKSRLVG